MERESEKPEDTDVDFLKDEKPAGNLYKKIYDENYNHLLNYVVDKWSLFENEPKRQSTSKYHRVSKSSRNELGKIYFKNGNRFEGSFIGKPVEGKGIFKWKDGSVYEGSFHTNEITGHGKLLYSNGAQYVGKMVSGIKHGKGVFKASNNSYEYRGYFKNGMFHGKGLLKASNCSFEGEFRFNRRFHGTWEIPTGTFMGIFDNTGCRRYGKFIMKNGDIYKGFWKNDKYDGVGVYQWTKLRQDLLKTKHFAILQPAYYIGMWQNALRHGIGQLNLSERIIMCLWENDRKHGPGLIVSANGELYIGIELFRNDRVYNFHRLIQPLSKEAMETFYNLAKMFCSMKKHVKRLYFNVDCSKDSFVNLIMELYRICKKQEDCLLPFFIPNHILPDLKEIQPIHEFLRGKLKTQKEVFEKLLIIEQKSLQQMLACKLPLFEEIYYRYAKTFKDENLEEISKEVVLTHTGLWFLYTDIFRQDSSFPLNASKLIEECETKCMILSLDKRCYKEVVYFWQFLRHLFFIVLTLNAQCPYIFSQNLKEKTSYYGLFATMLLTFLREIKSIPTFRHKLTRELIETNHLYYKEILKKTRKSEPCVSISSAYRYFKKLFLRKDTPENIVTCKEREGVINEKDFARCALQLFPNMIKNRVLVEIYFPITPLEFVELLLKLFQKSAYVKKFTEEPQNEEICSLLSEEI